jgi:hypothetical protein
MEEQGLEVTLATNEEKPYGLLTRYFVAVLGRTMSDW